MRSSTASRTPASRRVDCDPAVEPLAAERERHQRRADRTRHRQPTADPVPRRHRDAERKALLADGDRREPCSRSGRGHPRSRRRPATASRRPRAPRSRSPRWCRTPTRRRVARRRPASIHRSAWASARAARARPPAAAPSRTTGAGAAGTTGGLSASAMNTAAARARSSQSRAASMNWRVWPQHGDREAIALIGHPRERPRRRSSPRCPAPTRAPPSPPRRWDTRPSRRRARARRRRAIRPNSRVRLMRPRAGSRIFCPARSRPGVSYRWIAGPRSVSARCWPPASRSAPRRAVATSISAASTDGAEPESSGRPRSSPAISRSGWATATAASTWTPSPARRRRARTLAHAGLQRRSPPSLRPW